MLIDNGGHIAKISGPLPGMEMLRYIYIRIWQSLLKHAGDSNAGAEQAAKRLLDEYASGQTTREQNTSGAG